MTFAADADYAAQYFNGQTVPGDNTIDTTTHESHKARAYARVKKALGLKIADSDPSDDYGALKEAELFCYGILLSGGTLNFSKGSDAYNQLMDILDLDVGPALVTKHTYQDVYGKRFDDKYIRQ